MRYRRATKSIGPLLHTALDIAWPVPLKWIAGQFSCASLLPRHLCNNRPRSCFLAACVLLILLSSSRPLCLARHRFSFAKMRFRVIADWRKEHP